MVLMLCLLAALNGNIVPARQISLVEKYSIGSVGTNQVFIDIEGLSTNSKYLFITDKVLYKCMCFEKATGKFEYEYGKKGRKDGEFRGPGALAADDEYVAVADFTSSRIQFFQIAAFSHSSYMVGNIVKLGFDRDNQLWASVFTGTAENKLVRLDPKGSLTEEIVLKNSSNDMFDAIFSFSIDRKSSTIVAAYYTRNIVEFWKSDGTFLKSISVPGLPMSSPRIEIGKKSFFSSPLQAPDGNVFVDVAIDARGMIYLLTGDYSENPYRDIYICNLEGEYVGRITLTEKATKIHIDGSTMYCVIGNKSQVRTYDIIYRDSKRK